LTYDKIRFINDKIIPHLNESTPQMIRCWLWSTRQCWSMTSLRTRRSRWNLRRRLIFHSLIWR
jgi:hypothetical protein